MSPRFIGPYEILERIGPVLIDWNSLPLELAKLHDVFHVSMLRKYRSDESHTRIKISVNTDISVIGFYGNIGNIGKISVDIFTKISVINVFYILII